MAGEGLRGQSELTQRVISAAVMAVAAIAIAWYGSWPFALVWCAMAAAVAYEWGRIVDASQAKALAIEVGTLGLVLVVTLFLMPQAISIVIAVGLGGILGTLTFSKSQAKAWLAIGATYAFLLALCTILVRGQGQFGFVAILYMFAVVWMTDIGAYFAGRKFGGPKFAPTISPKKTWSGVVGGLLCGTLCSLGVLAASGVQVKISHGLLSLMLGVAVVFGDLFESFLKRRFGVKDAGTLIPGHGGFLDRLDGFVLAIALAALIGLIRGGAGNVPGGLLGW